MRLKLIFLISPLLLQFIGTALFGAFFFSYESPTVASTVGLPNSMSERPPSEYGRVVIFLVDALRADMAFEGNMPYVQQLLRQSRARAYVARAQTPTVTMPRLKALTTGTVPKFIDALLNFGGSEMRSPSIISSFKDHGLRTVLYGDDTWIQLFPGQFDRSDATTSFFTKDTVEVHS